jgi:hypothetical protein
MRRFQQHPILLSLVVLAVLGLAAPLAYAVVDHLELFVDPDDSEQEIEAELENQLAAAGQPADVEVAKFDGPGGPGIKIGLAGPNVDPSKLDIVTPGGAAIMNTPLEIEVTCELTKPQHEALTRVVTSIGFLELVMSAADHDDAELQAAVSPELAKHGFRDLRLARRDGRIVLTITAPPR